MTENQVKYQEIQAVKMPAVTNHKTEDLLKLWISKMSNYREEMMFSFSEMSMSYI